MTTTTPGRRFYDEQIVLLQQGRTDDLIDQHYHENAILISFTNVVRGHADLKKYFRDYVTQLGELEILSLDQFVETDDSIFFEAKVRTAIGEAKVYDAFVLRDGKATHHFTGVK